MKYFNYSLIILFSYFFSISAHSSDIKKWTDENGRVYYGDTPPRSTNSKTIKTFKRPTKLGKPLPRLNTSNTSNEQSKKPASAPPSTLEPEQAKEACDIAKKDLAVIKSSSRIQLRAADGSLRYMTKEEIKQRTDRSTSDIEKFCQ